MAPYALLFAFKMGPLVEHMQQNPSAMDPREFLSQIISATISSPLYYIGLIAMTYLSVNWLFALALVIDKKMGFWTAMCTSWTMVHKHWFQVFGLLVLIGLINVAGVCMCCIGALVTIPAGLAALMYAYEDIFGRKTA
jgi:membrane-anchored glycerophosphoryl diester phosphodiesterase (GDPDase)